MTPPADLPPDAAALLERVAVPVITPLFGRWVFARARALTGSWTVNGRVIRFAIRRARWDETLGRGAHLIVGPWCLTLARLEPLAAKETNDDR